uniref:Uncharacterized protein n=1 Tax=viral metagenome TaxID=1070528 RepID=A0A6C0BBK3_9ZZZZ
MTVRLSMKKMKYKKKISRNTRKKIFRNTRKRNGKNNKKIIKREKTPIERLMDDNIIDGDLGID